MVTESTSSIKAQVQGQITGQIAVGNYIVQIGSINGGIVKVVEPGQVSPPRPRPSPVLLLPRRLPGLLDRDTEVGAAIAALRSHEPVEFYGPQGIGKTALLRHLAHYAPTVISFQDGVVYLPAPQQSIVDLLQSLFDAFYESDVPFKPTEAEIRRSLQNTRALVLLDDVELARDEVRTLIDAAPGCTFLLASLERHLWEEGHSVSLRGLPPDASLMLVERELGRSLALDERPAAKSLCATLEGHPLRLLQAVVLAREAGSSLGEIARQALQNVTYETVTAQILAPLSEAEQHIVDALAILGGTAVSVEHLAALTDLPDPIPILEMLLRRGLVRKDGARYSLTGIIGDVLKQVQDVASLVERAMSHFVTWAEQQTPKSIQEDTRVILQTLEWGVRAGYWREVLRLVRTVEGALLLGKRLDEWSQTLQWALQAAQKLNDRSAEAWALHQLGICAFTLGDTIRAHSHLRQALRLRETLGDEIGAGQSRLVLNQLRALRAFLCHSSGDKPAVRDLYRRLQAEGIDPWLDEENLLPGQDWQQEIPKAVRASDIVIVCLSRNAISKAGYIQKEIKYALDVADEQPEGKIFLIPVKIEECDIPDRLSRWQWVNLFEERGFERLMLALRVRAKDVEAIGSLSS